MPRLPSIATIDQLILIALLRIDEGSAARIREEVEAFASHRMPRGRLYARLDLLEADGQVRRAGSADDWPRRFKATAKGRATVRALRKEIREFLKVLPRAL